MKYFKVFVEDLFNKEMTQVYSLPYFFIHINKGLTRFAIFIRLAVVLAICRISELLEAQNNLDGTLISK